MSEEKFTAQQKAFLAFPRYAVLSTINADGTPQSTVIWYIRDGDNIIFTTEADSLKARNMRRDPRVTLVITDGGRFISAKGKVELDDSPEAGSDWLLKIAKRYYGEEEGLNQFQMFNQKPQLMARLNVEKILSVSV